MAQWFVARDGKQQGPVSQEGLVQAITKGKVQATDLVWNDTLPSWMAVSEIPELAMALPGQSASTQAVAAHAAAAETSTAGTPTYDTTPPASAESSPAQGSQQIAYQSPFNPGQQVVATQYAMEMLRQTRPWVRLISIVLFVVAGLLVIGGLLIFGLGIAGGGMVGGPRGAAAGAGIFGIVMLLIYGIGAAIYIALGLYLSRYASSITALLNQRREDLLERALEAQRSFWRLAGIIVTVVIALYVVLFAVGIAAAAFA